MKPETPRPLIRPAGSVKPLGPEGAGKPVRALAVAHRACGPVGVGKGSSHHA